MRADAELTAEERALAARLLAEGRPEQYVKGYIRAGRTLFGNPQSTEKRTMATKKRKSRAKTPATATPPAVVVAAAPPPIPEEVVERFRAFWPIMSEEFAALADPNARPRGFVKRVVQRIADQLGIAVIPASDLYYAAFWRHRALLGVAVTERISGKDGVSGAAP